MPLFTFDHYQLTQLSLNSRSKPNEISPINTVSLVAALGAKEDRLKESFEDLLRLELIAQEGSNYKLALELEPAFLIMHQPKRVWKFYRESLSDIGEDSFCFIGSAGVQMTIGPAFSYNIIKYPYTEKLVDQWFKEEFIKDLEHPKEGLIDQRIYLSKDEMLIMAILQVIYKKRVEREGFLHDSMIDINELLNFKYWDELPESEDEENRKFLKLHLRNGENTLKTLASLRLKGLLVVNKSKIEYSIISKEIFSPSKAIDFIQFVEYGDDPKVATLNVVEKGFVLTRPLVGEDVIVLDILSSNHTTDDLYMFLLTDVTNEATQKDADNMKDTKVCQNCNNEVLYDAKFCKYCGSSLVNKQIMFCNNCGSEINEETVFCASCGARRKK